MVIGDLVLSMLSKLGNIALRLACQFIAYRQSVYSMGESKIFRYPRMFTGHILLVVS